MNACEMHDHLGTQKWTTLRGLTISAREHRAKSAKGKEALVIATNIVRYRHVFKVSNVTAHNSHRTLHNCSTNVMQRCSAARERVCQRSRQTCDRRSAVQALLPCDADADADVDADKPSSNLLKQLILDLHSCICAFCCLFCCKILFFASSLCHVMICCAIGQLIVATTTSHNRNMCAFYLINLCAQLYSKGNC